MGSYQEDQSEFDYIIAGGGLAGCALASRLSENLPQASIAVIEAGEDITSHRLTQHPLSVFEAHGSEIDWSYKTAPQPQLGGREIVLSAGKGLGGGSAINYGTWTRGSKLNYDLWAEVVGDEKWNYEHMLPYFKRSETSSVKDPSTHGSDGPIYNFSISASDPDRHYPLRESVRAAYEQNGQTFIADGDAGDPIGVAEIQENWRDGLRQTSAKAYKLHSKRVTIILSTAVQRVLIDPTTKRATGVEFATGTQIHARKEIIVSAGAFRTPQVLMLSGIGPKSELEKYNIPIIHENPAVGTNLHDHAGLYIPYRLRHPELDLAVGSETFLANPANLKGFPYDFMLSGYSTEAPTYLDPTDIQTVKLSNPSYAHYESGFVYAPAGQPFDNQHLPSVPDGSIMSGIIVGFATTSRGSMTLSSSSSLDHPIIDPRYIDTKHDLTVMRTALREQLNIVFGTPAMQAVVEREVTPPGCKELTLHSTDPELDERIIQRVQQFFHPAGSASMGTVVDTKFRVKGIEGLRVCDASVMPISISAHLQACTYALAERAAEMITADA